MNLEGLQNFENVKMFLLKFFKLQARYAYIAMDNQKDDEIPKFIKDFNKKNK